MWKVKQSTYKATDPITGKTVDVPRGGNSDQHYDEIWWEGEPRKRVVGYVARFKDAVINFDAPVSESSVKEITKLVRDRQCEKKSDRIGSGGHVMVPPLEDLEPAKK